jgi:hypothetical protein
LAGLLLENGNRHVTAEQLHSEALGAAIPVSLATVYNTLHQFIQCGILRELVIEPGRSYFDTNLDDHHHFYCESTGLLQDIPGELVMVGRLPQPRPAPKSAGSMSSSDPPGRDRTSLRLDLIPNQIESLAPQDGVSLIPSETSLIVSGTMQARLEDAPHPVPQGETMQSHENDWPALDYAGGRTAAPHAPPDPDRRQDPPGAPPLVNHWWQVPLP